MGSGKSTVAALLADRGAVIIDADRIARQVAQPGGSAYQALVAKFGPGVVLPDGNLDRPALAARAFSDPAALAELNAITHPAIAALMAEEIATHRGYDRVVVLDIPLLGPGARSQYGLAGVIVVDTPVEVARQRLVDQRRVDESDARARMAAQPSRDERLGLADIVIDNRGSRQDLARSVDQVWAWIMALTSEPEA